jgi:hypothetical protein
MRSLHHHRSQIPVSFFADALLWLALPGVPPPRSQPQKTTDLATLQKPVWIFYRQDIRQRDLRSYPLHLLEQDISATPTAGLSDRITESSSQPSTGVVIFDSD